jgi:hypothetical protein
MTNQPYKGPPLPPPSYTPFPAPTRPGGGASAFNARSLSGLGAPDAPTLFRNNLGRWAETERFNRFSVVGNTTQLLGWTAVKVDRPTLLVAKQQASGTVFYRPHAAPIEDGSGNIYQQALQAFGPGICYLHTPGLWWVKYHASISLVFLMVAADDPGLVGQLLTEPGCMLSVCTAFTTNAVANTAESLIGANPDRRGLAIYQSQSSTGTVAIGIGTAVPNAIAPNLLGHLIVGAGSNLTLTGEWVYKGQIFVAAQLASVNLAVVELE